MVAEVVGDPAAFAHEVEQDRVRRASTAGSCAADLSPDLKDGLGGLRDIAALGWLAPRDREPLDRAGVARHADLAAIDEAEEFLVRARSAVQLETGKRVDRLSADVQPEVAASMGFDDEPGSARDRRADADGVRARADGRRRRAHGPRPDHRRAERRSRRRWRDRPTCSGAAAADGTIAPALVDAVAAAADRDARRLGRTDADAFLAMVRSGEAGVAASTS